MKKLPSVITSCFGCPFLIIKEDAVVGVITTFHCRLRPKKSESIPYYSFEEITDLIEIQEGCPLPDY
jgi:hypothetical protein